MGTNPYSEEKPPQPELERRYSTCRNCGEEHVYPVQPQDEWVREKVEERIDHMYSAFQGEIDWLDDLFPDVPIREAMEKRCEDMMRALELAKKGLHNEMSFEEECEFANIMEEYSPDDHSR